MSAEEHRGDAVLMRNRRHSLRRELNTLAKRQFEALRTAMVGGMTGEEAEDYLRRHRRITNLMKVLVQRGASMSRKRKKMHGTVTKVIKPTDSSAKEKVEIDILEAEPLYREIRVENELMGDKGEKASLKLGADVDIVVEADSDATLKRPE